MSNNFVLDRIKKQIPVSTVVETKKEVSQPQVETRAAPSPIAPEELRKVFMSELNPVTPEPISTPAGEQTFNGIEEFVQWYAGVKELFDERQNIALSTLRQAASIINVGCKCKRNNRIQQANEYFKTFWLNNQKTDLVAKLLQVGAFSSVTFAVDGQAFLKIPLTQ
jgi:hypothetical protein